jgi:DNA processing protein
MPGSAPAGKLLGNWLLLGLISATRPSTRRAIETFYGSLAVAAARGPEDWRHHKLLRSRRGRDTLGPDSQGTGPETLPFLEDTGGWVEDQLRAARERGVRILVMGDPEYPGLLEVAPGPPPVIYVAGDPAVLGSPSVAVVGARRASAYGRRAARLLVRGLVRSGLVVVSGGARGIDSEAHLAALEEGGRTVSVMGSGLDVPYPGEHAGLFGRIAESGVVASEFPFGVGPQPRNFPIRNRVIAGLSLAVVVVEGMEGSGSLITAARALDAGREVCAVPGPITSPLSEGPNRLIVEGARLARSAADVIEELPWWAGVETPAPGEPAGDGALPAPSEEEGRLLEALDEEKGSTADEIASKLGLGPGDLLGRLTELELRGLIEQLPGGRFFRRS